MRREDIALKFFISERHPDTGVGFISSDISNPIPARALYSDYKNCFVLKIIFNSQEICLQWVAPRKVNAPPKACSAAFNEKCGDSVLLYNDSCQ
ncbi:hypothetical protein V5799_030255 [Amblyomma americanum]|uniref:Lipocalin n=1 Tax=Amblyomma americanum TaxID=6943 RepID=A0AAQ4ENY0_AMBAM